jgi:metallo-beta-lactamase family protein
MAQPPLLRFLGAAGTVTGSKFLFEHGDSRVLVDCGLYQGLRELRLRNWEQFPENPSSIDAVVLTHAHLDHCGYLPALVRDGFSGPVVATGSTLRLTEIVLRDSAHLQEEDARYAEVHGTSRHRPPRPLYTTEDVDRVLPLFSPIDFDTATEVTSGIRVTLRPAGHILGSSSVVLAIGGRTALITGDLGRPTHPLLKPPPSPPAVDGVLTESTYGDRNHSLPRHDQLAEVINRTVHRGGTVLIPAFAVDRTEVVLYALRLLVQAGTIPRLPIYVDSPMALASLDVYRDAIEAGAPDLRPGLAEGGDPFDPGTLHEARSVEQSIRLNHPGFPCVLLSASGMAAGGRVVHHLAEQLPDPANAIVLVGYQAVGTRGRDLVEGARSLKMLGRYVPVRAEVVDLPDYSVHADCDELVEWLGTMPSAPSTCYVVHGEPAASTTLARRLGDDLGWLAVVPRHLERVRLD